MAQAQRLEMRPITQELISIIDRMKMELEAWEETLEILADKETMKSLERSRRDVEKGRVISFSSVEELRKKYK